MRSALARIGGIGALVAIVGCMAVEDPPDVDTLADSPRSSDRFVTLRRDFRRCAAPLCGGYFIHEVNLDTPEAYVSQLVFEGSGLDEETIQSIRQTPVEELVLQGYLGVSEPTFNTRPFIVRAAYRGLPGRTPASSDAFYSVHKRVPRIECFTTPCPNEIAVKLNTEARDNIDAVSVAAAALAFVDRAWLTSRVERRSALVAGALREASSSRRERQVLLASQVFLRLPERVAPCPTAPTPSCGDKAVALRRTQERCLVFDRCVDRGICPDVIPACAEGYTRVSWPAAPAACAAFACEPTFATE